MVLTNAPTHPIYYQKISLNVKHPNIAFTRKNVLMNKKKKTHHIVKLILSSFRSEFKITE